VTGTGRTQSSANDPFLPGAVAALRRAVTDRARRCSLLVERGPLRGR